MSRDRATELCLASPVLIPPRGGAELRFLSYLHGLRERGVHTRIVTGTPKAKKLTRADGAEDWYRVRPGEMIPTEPVNGARVERVRLPDATGWRRTIHFNRTLLAFCRQPDYRPDVLQLLTPLPPRSAPWLLRLGSMGVARVFADTLPAELPARPVKRLLRWFGLRVLYTQLDCLVTPSDVTRDLTLGLGVKIRTEVIPNGVDLNRFHPRSDDASRAVRAALGIEPSDMMVAAVGAVIPRKGIDLLLEAWIRLAKRHPRAHLVVVGPRTDQSNPELADFHRRLEALIAACGAPERVHFTGKVDDVDAYLRASDIFVFPSRKEGMCNAVLEAMASGVPVVLTPHIGLSKDFGEPDQQYLLVERDPDALAAVVERLIENFELRARLGSGGRYWVEKVMDLEQTLDRYAAMYHALADQARARRSSSPAPDFPALEREAHERRQTTGPGHGDIR
jgi:glycosyltransferase involved in cell wall biosynthesis